MFLFIYRFGVLDLNLLLVRMEMNKFGFYFVVTNGFFFRDRASLSRVYAQLQQPVFSLGSLVSS